MQAIQGYLLSAYKYILSVNIFDIFDILIVALIFYYVVTFLRKSSTMSVAKVIMVIFAALWLSGQLRLNSLNFLLRKTAELGFLALVILFQPELRRVLEKVGSRRFTGFFVGNIQVLDAETAITQVALAFEEMASAKTGALVIFERDNNLEDQMNTGTILGAETTAELIKNIFFPKAPLHDGAVIIRDGKIAAAGCMLPLSANANLSRDLGMRHRAGIGMSERSDAVIAMVSEETGSISVAVDGMLKRHLTTATFEKLLRNELMVEDAERESAGSWLSRLVKGKK